MVQVPERRPGAPGASGAPVKPAEGGGLDDGAIPHEWLDEAGFADLADEVDRLAGDLAWVNQLELERFTGPRWDLFVTELAKYGLAVIGGWMATGAIYEKCKYKGLGGVRSLGRTFSRDEIDELSGETVAKALRHFRDDILMRHKWDSRKGASLRTYFVGQCLIRYANVHRRWLGYETRNHMYIASDPSTVLDVLSEDDSGLNTAKTAINRLAIEDALSSIKDERVLRAMVLTAAGRTQAEIAEELGVSEKTVERMLGNQRARFKRATA